MSSKFSKFIYFLFFFLLFLSRVFSQYYVDSTIQIFPDGTVSIKSFTNNQFFEDRETQEFTSKAGSLWNFNLTSIDSFDNFSYELIFPEGVSLKKFESTGYYSFQTKENKLVVSGFGKNSKIQINAYYEISKHNFSFIEFLNLLFFGLIFFVLIFGFFVFKKFFKKKNVPSINLDSLTERQKQIVSILSKKGSSTQAELQKITGFPKASLSRNLASLEKKGLVSKQRKGMTMYIELLKEEKK